MAMADDTRQRILAMLSEREMTVSQVVSGFSWSQPTISYHLRVLRRANLVSTRREGTKIFYRFNAACVAVCCGEIQALFTGRAQA